MKTTYISKLLYSKGKKVSWINIFSVEFQFIEDRERMSVTKVLFEEESRHLMSLIST